MSKPQTTDDIVEALLTPATAAEPKADDNLELPVVTEVDPDLENLEDHDEPTLEADPLDEDADLEDDPIPSEGNEDEDDEDDNADSTDEPTYLDITDEDLIEVKVDGEVVYRTVEDAKKALSGEGAIEKRLKEATETRKQAVGQYETGARELETRRQHMLDAVQAIDGMILQPTVSEPDSNLRLSNPTAYLQSLDAFKADQARITHARTQLTAKIKEQAEARTAARQQRHQNTERQLLVSIPDLADAKKQPIVMQGILDVAREYGFSNEEMAEFFDARSYKMAHDLAKLRKAVGKKVNTGKVLSKGQKKTSRRLRSGVAKKLVTARTDSKARKAAQDRARSTGKVDDIVSIITKPGRRSK
jgi:hypothetical protein